MTVSIIIAVKGSCANLDECVNKCLQLKGLEHEIIVLPDEPFEAEGVLSHPRVKIIPTGDVTPPLKRDRAAQEAKGAILAFIDDDAYPDSQWLERALPIFSQDKDVICVCGPAVTPESDTLRQKASGLIYSALLVSGHHAFRYLPQRRRFVVDFPSVNFLVRKSMFLSVGGFGRRYWPGEDTFLCLKVLSRGKKMVYDPGVLVYHHRRPLFLPHLKQVRNYAMHRGYFAKRHPKTSFCIEYFLPSFFLIALVAGGALAFFFPRIAFFYDIGLRIYVSLILLNSLWFLFSAKTTLRARFALLFLTFLGIMATHLTYGLMFLRGLLARKMPEE